jgi:hypothetical protein
MDNIGYKWLKICKASEFIAINLTDCSIIYSLIMFGIKLAARSHSYDLLASSTISFES